MTSDTLKIPTSRGRPRKFDEDAVLDTLTDLFWDKGYEATSMADILTATGLNKSSLYNSFGSKKDLFRRILDRYVAQRMEGFADMAEANKQPGLEALHAFLDAVFEFGRAGCLAVNTTTELGTTDPVVSTLARTYRDRIREALQKVLTVTTSASSPSEALIRIRTEMLLGFLLGYAVAARTGAETSEMDGLAHAAHATIDAW